MSRGSAAARQEGRKAPRAPSPQSPAQLTLNDRLLRERDLARARELFRTLGLGVLVLVPLLLHVWQQVSFVETAYEVAELRAGRQQLQTALRKIRLERATLESLERIEVRARRAGMIQPPPEAVVTVLEDRGAGGETRP